MLNLLERVLIKYYYLGLYIYKIYKNILIYRPLRNPLTEFIIYVISLFHLNFYIIFFITFYIIKDYLTSLKIENYFTSKIKKSAKMYLSS